MDEHYNAIQNLCNTHYHDSVISATVRDEIIHHLIRTRHPEKAIELIVNRLTVESRIEVLADVLLISDLMNDGIMKPDEQILKCTKKFEKADRILGKFVSNRFTDEQKNRLVSILVKELNLVVKSRESDLPFDEIQEQAKRLQDKSVYSYQTLLELSIGSRRARFTSQSEIEDVFNRLKAMVKISIDSFKLYRS